MNPIYRTRWGAYVDLSKIVAITKSQYDPLTDLLVYFQFSFYENGKDLGPVSCDPENNDEAFKQDLIDAWNKYINTRLVGTLEKTENGFIFSKIDL